MSERHWTSHGVHTQLCSIQAQYRRGTRSELKKVQGIEYKDQHENTCVE